ncbi:MAG: ATP-dependent protease [Chloroflexi bacterium]|nr:MAG: ATP-dependent protease [Chloroflexota bacterium]
MTNNAQPELELQPAQLSRTCPPERFEFSDTSQIQASRTIYGQPRGVRAIEFGLRINSHGYNIYVLGPTDSDRVRTIKQFISDRAARAAPADDWCYVYNFDNPRQPRVLRLPAGQGNDFKAGMNRLVEVIKTEIVTEFDNDMYRAARNKIVNQFDDQRRMLFDSVQQMAVQQDFTIQTMDDGGIAAIPTKRGKPLTPEEVDKLSDKQREQLMQIRRRIDVAIDDMFVKLRNLQGETRNALDQLNQQFASRIIDAQINTIFDRAKTPPEIAAYLTRVRADMLDNIHLFLEDRTPQDGNPPPGTPGTMPPESDPFRRYDVNVLVSNDPANGLPVIYADFPTYRNLIGRIEHEVHFGVVSTDFTHIRSGALHQANGGFLLLRAPDILGQPFAWDALKRALSTKSIVIEDEAQGGVSVISTQGLDPEPIPVNVTVIMIGEQDLYYRLYALEEDFPDLFRVKADFGETMTRNTDAELQYATFVATRCEEEHLPHFTAEAVGRIVEYGSWLVSDQRKLSTEFGQVARLIREAAFFSRVNKRDLVSAADVDQAIRERTYRNNELEELAQERIADGTILIDVDKEVVGQVNGLAAVTVSDHTFGLPSRITAQVSMGRNGLVQIDREIEIAGPIHNKGVLTLEGYLNGRYGQDFPLTLNASVTFEQNYGGVEGDSASSAELFALLSALANIPLRQYLAVTGSVNQRGQIQPVGGVTQKIEGFYLTCKRVGLTGRQGVIIPRRNVPHLMLNNGVTQAVANKEFHIYAIDTVDEGIALLTGHAAEKVHQAVNARLRELFDTINELESNRRG